MRTRYHPIRKIQTTLPGTALFILLYILATLLYPGGSQSDPHSKGFSWTDNYWCNLLNTEAINGEPNPARPVALIALVILSLTLALFWYRFPRYTQIGKNHGLMIQSAGIASMTIVLLLPTPWHDAVINLSGFFGLIALAGTFAGLYICKWRRLLGWGFFNLLLVGINSYVYNTKQYLHHLPVIQKISFLSFLLWLCCIEIAGRRTQNVTATSSSF